MAKNAIIKYLNKEIRIEDHTNTNRDLIQEYVLGILQLYREIKIDVSYFE